MTDILTKDERAYRRGALQAIQFLIRDLYQTSPHLLWQKIALWEQELIAGRESSDPKYLGTYLDEVMSRVHQTQPCNSTLENAPRVGQSP